MKKRQRWVEMKNRQRCVWVEMKSRQLYVVNRIRIGHTCLVVRMGGTHFVVVEVRMVADGVFRRSNVLSGVGGEPRIVLRCSVLMDEDKARQNAILELAVQFDNACTAKDDLRKAYEKCNDIPQESRALIDTFLKEESDIDYEMNISMYGKAAK
ncbi:hypothetical protein Tco_0057593 [Tanacetum coccineum]